MERTIYAGINLEFKKSFSDYKASEWELKYILVNDENAYSITAISDGDDFLIKVPATTTSSWESGFYQYSGIVSKGGDKYIVERGTCEIKSNPALSSVDVRSHAKKMLDAIEAILEGRAGEDINEYVINGRQISKMTLDELIKARSYYLAEYQRELQAERMKLGLGTGRKILVRFVK